MSIRVRGTEERQTFMPDLRNRNRNSTTHIDLRTTKQLIWTNFKLV